MRLANIPEASIIHWWGRIDFFVIPHQKPPFNRLFTFNFSLEFLPIESPRIGLPSRCDVTVTEHILDVVF